MRRLFDLLRLPPWIARQALRATAWHCVFVGAVTIVKSGTNALYLARSDLSLLPLMYVAVAVVVGIATSVLARLLVRRTPAQVLTAGVVAAMGALLVACALVVFGVPGAPGVVYVVGEVAATTGSVLFWARVMDAFSARDQKKVVGLVGAGGMLGAAIGGFAMRVVAEHTGVLVPMVVSAIAVVVALPLLRGLRSKSRRGLRADDGELRRGMRYLLGKGYPVIVALFVVLLAATGAATDFVFRAASAQSYDEAELAGVFGLLNAVVGVVVVVFQLSLTRLLLARVGVFAFVALVPMLLVAVSFVHLFQPASFEVLLVLKGIEMAGAFSLNQAAVSLLYNPMPADLQSQVRTLVDGAVKKSGAALAGLFLWGLASLAPFLIGSWLVAVVAGAALVLIPLLRLRYLDALDEKLGAAEKKVRHTAIDPTDGLTRGALLAALHGTDPAKVLAALDALGEDFTLSIYEVVTLMESDDERVRMAALARAPQGRHPLLEARLIEIAGGSGARRPRAVAVRALAKVTADHGLSAAHRFLDEDEPGVATAAIETALRAAPADLRARARLDALVRDLPTLSAPWRREIARLLGALDEARYDGALASLLDDGDASVRVLAIQAAGRERHETHMVPLVRCLGDLACRAAASAALVRYGDLAVPALSAILDDRSQPVSLRIHVPRVLGRIGTAAAAHALVFSNPRDDAYLQQRIVDALVKIVEGGADVAIDKDRTNEAIGRRLVAHQAYAEIGRDLAAAEGTTGRALSLLARAVDQRCQQNLKIALVLLGLHRGLARMTTVYRGLTASSSTTAAARHDALELLDAALTGERLREDFLSLLEAANEAGQAGRAIARALALVKSRDPLLRSIARRTVRVLGVEDVAPAPGTGDFGALRVPASGVSPGLLELEGEDMADDIVERLFLLEHVDLFEGLATDDVAAIATIATELSLPAGAYLYREGELGTSLFVIVQGVVDLTRKSRPVLTLREGESAGQVSFLDRGPRPVTARVSGGGPARLLVVEREAFLDLMSDRPGLMHAFFGVLAARLRALIEREQTGGRSPTGGTQA